MTLRSSIGLVIGLLLGWLSTPTAQAQADDADPAFLVIVHAQNPIEAIERSKLSRIFLKKTKRWEDGETIMVLDHVPDSETRDRFTRGIHGKSISAIKSYWQRMIFSGRDVPPEEIDGDVEVLRLVVEHRGSVGYIAATTELPEGVKVLTVEE